jgi:hypothetical protein
MPITRPAESASAPPELPGFSAACRLDDVLDQRRLAVPRGEGR